MTGAAGRLTLVKETEIVRSTTAIHDEETGAPRYLIQVIFYAVAPDSHYVIGRPVAQPRALGPLDEPKI